MRIDIVDDNMDIKPGSIFRAILESWIPDWEDCAVLYLEKNPSENLSVFKSWMIHNEVGPAVIKKDGSMEWWLGGKRLFCQSQKEFESYMKNKAFW